MRDQAIDLEALAAEAEELEDNVPEAPVVEDLEIGELESLADEAGPADSPQKEIEISFEGDLADDANEKRKDIARLYPGSQQIWVDSGHGIPLEKPETVIAAIRQVLPGKKLQ